jgi:hypothetical protein
MRGQRAIRVGAILIAVGVILAIVGGILANTNAYSRVNGFQRLAVKDGTGTVTFTNAGGYVAYYESGSVTDSTSQKIPEIPVRLTNEATGQTLTLSTPYGDRADGKIKYLHYDHGGHKGLAMWQFHIDQAGTYKVEVAGNAFAAGDAVVAFGKSIARGVVVGGVMVIFGIVVLLAGVITLIVGFVRQRRHKRDLRAVGYGGPAAFGGGQPAGWPSPPGGSPAWPPGGGQPPRAGPGGGGQQPTWPPSERP